MENSIKQERLHLRVFDDSIDILYRPNHSYIAFVKNDENGKNEVKRLALMSRDEFKVYLKNCHTMPLFTSNMVDTIKTSKAEEWYQGAWKMQTNKLLRELNIENPIEIPIFTNEMIDV